MKKGNFDQDLSYLHNAASNYHWNHTISEFHEGKMYSRVVAWSLLIAVVNLNEIEAANKLRACDWMVGGYSDHDKDNKQNFKVL